MIPARRSLPRPAKTSAQTTQVWKPATQPRWIAMDRDPARKLEACATVHGAPLRRSGQSVPPPSPA
ncbi:hypothetical protein SBV1_2880003 [Verrucomicrobia bacterium]|nr:hypothetical protein SBV1_2880003 [Verrucomicrobiota bacterium]